MDWVKLAAELYRIAPDWEYHTHIESGKVAHIRALKGNMAYSVKYQGEYVMAEGVYPKEFLPIDPEKLPYSRMLGNHSETAIAAHIIGTFLPKYQRLFAGIDGRITTAIDQRYTLARKLEEVSSGLTKITGSDQEFPELRGHRNNMDVEASVRSGDLVYLDLVVPGDVAREIIKLIGMLSGTEVDRGNGPASTDRDS